MSCLKKTNKQNYILKNMNVLKDKERQWKHSRLKDIRDENKFNSFPDWILHWTEREKMVDTDQLTRQGHVPNIRVEL